MKVKINGMYFTEAEEFPFSAVEFNDITTLRWPDGKVIHPVDHYFLLEINDLNDLLVLLDFLKKTVPDYIVSIYHKEGMIFISADFPN